MPAALRGLKQARRMLHRDVRSAPGPSLATVSNTPGHHAVLLMPHRRSSRACHMARHIALGYSISYHRLPASSSRLREPRQPQCVESWLSGAVVVVILIMPKISHRSPWTTRIQHVRGPGQTSRSTQPNGWPMTPLAVSSIIGMTPPSALSSAKATALAYVHHRMGSAWMRGCAAQESD